MNDTVAKIWFAADVIAEPAAAAAIESALDALDPLGTEINNLGRPNDEPICVTAYFDDEPDPEALQRCLAEHLEIFGLSDIGITETRIRKVENADWLAEWKRHWRPTVAGRFVIAPPWADVPAGEHVLITIEPNMAFGTGTHETTRLCLEAIGEEIAKGDSFFDVGTGTGILAIAAAKLGAGPIFACDTDGDSVAIARDNAKANGVGDLIEFSTGSIEHDRTACDVVCANLTVDVILPLLDRLLASANRTLLLSGILREQESMILQALADRGLTDIRVREMGEWIAVLVRISPASRAEQR